MAASADRPYPPLPLANRVLSLEGAEDPLAQYERLGAETRAALLELLPGDWRWDGRRVLDFGCGAGRTLRHFLAEAERAEVWGVDIDAPSVDWLRRTLCPPLHVARCGAAPPLPFGAGEIDLAWAISVFTHLTDQSVPWLLELHRVLRPGGLLVATYMGRWNSEVLAGEPWDEDRVGMNVLRHHNGWEHGGPMVLMSDWWVRAHWGRAFEIVSVAPRVHNQTWVLLRRRDVTLSVEEVLEPEPGEPREISALRHNLTQTQRELERVLAEQASFYEGSLSWRLTRPLRALGRLRRSLTR